MRNILLSLSVGFAALLPAVSSAELRVIDGDTLEIDNVGYRINGIDAPEISQSCAGANGNWECGQAAAKALHELVIGREIRCEAHEKDPYGRVIATCWVGDTDLGNALVSEGLAWAYRRFSSKYVAVEDQARSRSLGIWQGDNQPAWEFRSERWLANVNSSPYPGCPIKGNISRNGMIYHTPWSPWYDRTVISEEKGERWFCDEAEAVRAGWRAPYWP